MHKIPQLLETEDLFLFGLTIRHCLILFVGAITSYVLFAQMVQLLPNPTAGLVSGLILALLFLSGMVALAFVHPQGRGLEEWGLVLLLYASRPRVWLWRPDAPDAFERRLWQSQQRRRTTQERFPIRAGKERAW